MIDIYLPIADIRVDLITLLFIGLITGLVSGLFGLGGGIVAVPFLTFLGIAPQIAVASVTNQMTAGTLPSFYTYARHNRVDYFLGGLLLCGGFIGNIVGLIILKILAAFGQVDLVISLGFLILLSFVSYTTIKDAIISLHYKRKKLERPHKKPIFYSAVSKLPLQYKFISSDYKTSAIVIIFLGIIAGILVMLLGIGGAFIIIPAMLHLLKTEEKFTSGTMQFQLVFTSVVATLLHAIAFNGVDILLCFILIIGTVVGSSIGSKIGLKIEKENFRIVLGIVILLICVRVGYDVFFEPKDIYKVVRMLK